jgi:hypothetical protein
MSLLKAHAQIQAFEIYLQCYFMSSFVLEEHTAHLVRFCC